MAAGGTLVARPVVQSDGLFGEASRAEAYVSDDQARIPVRIRGRVPVVGSPGMYLRAFRPGS